MKQEKYYFRSTRNKHDGTKPNVPDYDDVIEINGTPFTLTGWLQGMKSDISWTLERITPERLERQKFLNAKYWRYRQKKSLGK